MIVAAWITLVIAGGSCVGFAGSYAAAVRRPGRQYRAERHYMMLTSGIAFAALVACAVLLAVNAHIAGACIIFGVVVAASMLWRVRLLQRSQHQHDQQHKPDQLG